MRLHPHLLLIVLGIAYVLPRGSAQFGGFRHLDGNGWPWRQHHGIKALGQHDAMMQSLFRRHPMLHRDHFGLHRDHFGLRRDRFGLPAASGLDTHGSSFQSTQDHLRRHRYHHQPTAVLPRERQYEIKHANDDHIEIHLESRERVKGNVFEYEFEHDQGFDQGPSLRVKDARNSAVFDKVFRLPRGVEAQDITVRYLSDRVVLTIPNTKVAETGGSQPQPVRRDLDERSNSVGNTNEAAHVETQKVEIPEETYYELDQDDFSIEEAPADDDSEYTKEEQEDHPSQVYSGYVDNRGVFRPY
jgi:hypothetical protein